MNATQVSVKKLRKLSGELQRLAAEVDRFAGIQNSLFGKYLQEVDKIFD
jgi:hypothetical protein